MTPDDTTKRKRAVQTLHLLGRPDIMGAAFFDMHEDDVSVRAQAIALCSSALWSPPQGQDRAQRIREQATHLADAIIVLARSSREEG